MELLSDEHEASVLTKIHGSSLRETKYFETCHEQIDDTSTIIGSLKFRCDTEGFFFILNGPSQPPPKPCATHT